MSGRFDVQYDRGNNFAMVRGYGTRALLCEVNRGRPPLWNRTSRAWATSPKVARDAQALAESRGWVVTVGWCGVPRKRSPEPAPVVEPEPEGLFVIGGGS